MESDPIDLDGGLNTYSCGYSDPLRYFDIFAISMNRTQNLRAQTAMLPKTWDAFCTNGITPATALILDFAYVAPSKSAAESLAASLVSAHCRVRSEGGLRKRWFLEGQTAPMTTSLEKLQSWLEFMIDAGWQHGCAFDGFGAQIP